MPSVVAWSQAAARLCLCDDPPLHLALRILALGRNRVDLIDEDLNSVNRKREHEWRKIKLPYTESARLTTPTASVAFAPAQRRPCSAQAAPAQNHRSAAGSLAHDMLWSDRRLL
jgi:hypothetical protein